MGKCRLSSCSPSHLISWGARGRGWNRKEEFPCSSETKAFDSFKTLIQHPWEKEPEKTRVPPNKTCFLIGKVSLPPLLRNREKNKQNQTKTQIKTFEWVHNSQMSSLWGWTSSGWCCPKTLSTCNRYIRRGLNSTPAKPQQHWQCWHSSCCLARSCSSTSRKTSVGGSRCLLQLETGLQAGSITTKASAPLETVPCTYEPGQKFALQNASKDYKQVLFLQHFKVLKWLLLQNSKQVFFPPKWKRL